MRDEPPLKVCSEVPPAPSQTATCLILTACLPGIYGERMSDITLHCDAPISYRLKPPSNASRSSDLCGFDQRRSIEAKIHLRETGIIEIQPPSARRRNCDRHPSRAHRHIAHQKDSFSRLRFLRSELSGLVERNFIPVEIFIIAERKQSEPSFSAALPIITALMRWTPSAQQANMTTQTP